MNLYHEAPLTTLPELLAEGLKRTTRGDKGDDDAIKQTDNYLDDHCPAKLRAQHVSRNNSIYAFLGDETNLIDIQNGATLPIDDYPLQQTALLCLTVSRAHCFVSDLDRYDAVKAAVTDHDAASLPVLAARYWDAVVPLVAYDPGSITRPEVMITADLTPAQLTQVAP